MSGAVMIRSLPEPPLRIREALRYSGADESFSAEAADCFDECCGVLRYDVCFERLPVRRCGDVLDLTFAETDSRDLGVCLAHCDEIIIFAATVGIGIDRLISKYSVISPSRAVLLQGLGAERIESLCDAFCDGIDENEPNGIRPRFSPGYGDLPLEFQRRIFDALDPPRRIGLSLNGSLLMSPSKSVTAIIGIIGDSTDRPSAAQ